jgi:twitching motility protein PilT
MIMNPAIATLIRDNKIHLISNTIESGLAEGMCTMDQSLAFLVQRKLVDFEEALARAQSPKNFRALIAAGFASPSPKPALNVPGKPAV